MLINHWIILAATRWHLRRAVRVMNRVLAHLGLVQHPDKTGTCPAKPEGRRRIGRVSRGFDFLCVDFQPDAPLAPSAVSLARKTEKIARRDEQQSSVSWLKGADAPSLRIGRYDKQRQRWIRGLLGHSPPRDGSSAAQMSHDAVVWLALFALNVFSSIITDAATELPIS